MGKMTDEINKNQLICIQKYYFFSFHKISKKVMNIEDHSFILVTIFKPYGLFKSLTQTYRYSNVKI